MHTNKKNMDLFDPPSTTTATTMTTPAPTLSKKQILQQNIDELKKNKNLLLFVTITKHTFSKPNIASMEHGKFALNCCKLQGAEWKSEDSISVLVEYPIYSNVIMDLKQCRRQMQTALRHQAGADSNATMDRYHALYKSGKQCDFPISNTRSGEKIVQIPTADVYFVKPQGESEASQQEELPMEEDEEGDADDSSDDDDDTGSQSQEDIDLNAEPSQATKLEPRKTRAKSKEQPAPLLQLVSMDAPPKEQRKRKSNPVAEDEEERPTKRPRTEKPPAAQPTITPAAITATPTKSTPNSFDFSSAYAHCSMLFDSSFKLPKTRQELALHLFREVMNEAPEQAKKRKASFKYMLQFLEKDSDYAQLFEYTQQ